MFINNTPIDSDELYLPGSIETHPCAKSQTCPSCNGDCYCSDCLGLGKTKCSNCGGSGEMWCETCDGQGQCPKCDGKHYLRCSWCDGSGYIMEGGKPARCHRCGGDGRLVCDFCHGDGLCPTCKGHKKETCSSCHGKGKEYCSECGGSGRCTTCSGAGEIACQRCKGTGNYQSYLAIRAHRYTKEWTANQTKDNTYHTGNKIYDKILNQKAKGEVIYAGTYREWRDAYAMEYDKEVEMQKRCLEQMTQDERSQFLAHMKQIQIERKGSAKLSPNSASDKPMKSEISVSRVPVTTIYYTINGKEYSLHIEGIECNGVKGNTSYDVWANELPTSIEAHKTSAKQERKLSNGSPKKRAIAMLQLGFYISHMHGDEMWDTPLRYAIARAAGINHASSYIKMKYPTPKTEEELLKCIEPLLYSTKTITFCWHCMAIDHTPNKDDEKLLNKIAALINVPADSVEELKYHAKGIQGLKEAEMIESYVEASEDMRGVKGCLWVFLILLCCGVYIGFWGLPGWAQKYTYYYNSRIKKEIKKGQYQEAYITYRAFKGDNLEGTIKTALPLVEGLAAYPLLTENEKSNNISMADDVFERYKPLYNHKSKYQKKVIAMADTICSCYVYQNNLIKANYYLQWASLKSQVIYGDKAIEYLCKCGKQEWAKDYIKSGIKYIYKNVDGRHNHIGIWIPDDLDRYYNYDLVKARWQKILVSTPKDPKMKKDKNILNMLRKKSDGDNYIPYVE